MKPLTKNQKIKLFDPFATHWYTLDASMRMEISTRSDDDLRALIEAAKVLSTTNCGWASYHVAPEVVDYSKRELLFRREQRNERPE